MTEDEFILKSNETRGAIISATILLERFIDEYIAKYFTSEMERKVELIELLISSLTYGNKVQILERILRLKYKPSEFSKKFKGLKKELGDIAKTRNEFAHNISIVGLSEQNMKRFEICLVNFKNTGKPIGYTESDVGSYLNLVHKYIDLIKDLD